MSKFTCSTPADGMRRSYSYSYVICTTPRTGSNLLMLTLESLGLGLPEEYLNGLRTEVCGFATQVLQHEFSNGAGFFESEADIQQYVEYLQTYRCSENGVFGIKVFARDLNHNIQNFESFTKSIGTPTKYIFLKRKNIVKQAISMYIGSKDKQWVNSSGLSGLNTDVAYDFEWLLKAINYIRLCNQFWEKIMYEENENVQFLTYEDLSTDFPESIQRVCDFLGHKPHTIPSPPIQRQINPLKQQFYTRLKRDLIRMRG